MKHFIAYGGSTTGQDQSPVELDLRTILNYYLTPVSGGGGSSSRWWWWWWWWC